jgi:NADH:ubiquinone oxidoreductase subunit 3 (subunit A)
MHFLYVEYLPLFVLFVVATILAYVILGLSYLLSSKEGYAEKLSTYECGFDAYEDSRKTFEVRFYLVAILFLIFDLEISYLFPWALTLSNLSAFGFWTMAFFLILLTVGFIYEWKKGALDWS